MGLRRRRRADPQRPRGSRASALLTDWTATAPGPHTELGIEVQDTAAEVEANYGPLEPFGCDATVASVASPWAG